MSRLLQGDDFKTKAELIAAGGTEAQLLTDDKIYSVVKGKTLDTALGDGSIPALAMTPPADIADTPAVGVGITAARADHVHEGVHSVAADMNPEIYGDAKLLSGTRVTLTQSGKNITVATTAANVTSTVTPSDVATAPAIGVSVEAARADHAHEGLHSIAANMNPEIYGDAKLIAGVGISLEQVGSEITLKSTAEGGINFIENGDAEDVTLIFTGRSLTPAGRVPVQGATVAAANANFSITRNTLVPLYKTASWYLTKSGTVNTQGAEQVIPFTVQEAHMAKAITIQLDYKVISGIFTAGTRTTDSDVIVYIAYIDPADSIRKYIEPSNIKFLGSPTTFGERFQASFQTTATATSYELVFHSATTVTANFVLELDNISVGPSDYVYGTPVTDYATTPVPATTPANRTRQGYQWRRVGDEIEVRIAFLYNAASNFLFNISDLIPAGFSVNYTKLGVYLANGESRGSIGTANAQDTAVNVFNGIVSLENNGVVLCNLVSNNAFQFAPSTNDAIALHIRVPINGLSSSVQTSDQTDTRIVSFFGQQVAQTLTANVTNLNLTALKDTHGAWTGNSYVVPVAGDYIFSLYMLTTAAPTGSWRFYRNGSPAKYAAQAVSGSVSQVGTQLLENLVVGDVIQIRSEAAVTTVASGAFGVSVSRVSGPSAIAANELVALRYINTAGNTINAAPATVSFLTRIFDTHGAFNGTTFTAPASGTYEVKGAIGYSFSNASVEVAVLNIVVNGTTIKSNRAFAFNATDLLTSQASDVVQLKAGDTVVVQAAGSGTRTLLTQPIYNVISITRQGF